MSYIQIVSVDSKEEEEEEEAFSNDVFKADHVVFFFLFLKDTIGHEENSLWMKSATEPIFAPIYFFVVNPASCEQQHRTYYNF